MAVGAYNFCTGVSYLPASLIAGALWSVDPRWTFGLSAVLASVAIVLFGLVRPGSTAPPVPA